MTVLEKIAGAWFAILDRAAQGAAALAGRYSTRRRLSVVEGPDRELLVYPEGRTDGPVLTRVVAGQNGSGTSSVLRRSHVAIELDPDRIVFRTIELPGRATDFIEAIVRTQIDRLTPWRPEQVLFGWGEPVPAGGEGGIAVTVAATNSDTLAPIIARVQQLGASVVVARAPLPDDLATGVSKESQTVVLARATAAAFAVTFWRRCLGGAAAIVTVLVIGSSLYGEIASLRLSSEADALDADVTAKRALIAKGITDRDPAASARQVVLQRKAEAPFATLVLDAVSRTIPDDSYVTSFEVSGTTLRLVGFTTDAPALIRLLDASGAFADATFFAPTTRLPEDPGDRFNIEAVIRPGDLHP